VLPLSIYSIVENSIQQIRIDSTVAAHLPCLLDHSFELKNHTSDPFLKYFMEHPIRKWFYIDFEGAVNKSKQRTRSSTKTNIFQYGFKYVNDDRNVVPTDGVIV